MNKITRDRDIIFKNKDLEHLYTFKNFPTAMGCTNDLASEDILADMSWHISKKSGLIQLNPLLPLDVVYKAEHGSGTVGKMWDEHHQLFAEFICKYNVNNILEIGGLHGILSKKSQTINDKINWTIIDPNPIPTHDVKAKIIKGFFDENFTSEEKYDAIVHSHVLEHIYNPDLFMDNISSFIDDGGLLIFSVPNMDMMLKKHYTNCINFEHTLLLGEIYIEHLLLKFGFEIKEKKYCMGDHSIFYCAEKTNKSSIVNIPKNTYKEYKSLFEEYINIHIADVNKINNVIRNCNIPIYLFGAHVFSQYLISFGLETKNILGILDNDVNKKGKRLYGTNLISNTPSVLKDIPNALVILRAGVYNDEIKKDILENINPNIIFI